MFPLHWNGISSAPGSPRPQKGYEHVLTVDRLGVSQRRSPRFSGGTLRNESAPKAFWSDWGGKPTVGNISRQLSLCLRMTYTCPPRLLKMMMLPPKDVSLRNTAAVQ